MHITLKSALTHLLGDRAFRGIQRRYWRMMAGCGTSPRQRPEPVSLPRDVSEAEAGVINIVCPQYTGTSPVRVVQLIRALEHITRTGIEGDIVECGVWRGGSMMAAAMTLMKCNSVRDLYLYDTFEGMPAPSREDVRYDGVPASDLYAARGGNEDRSNWFAVSREAVEKAVLSTGYPAQHVKLVKGKVEETIPGTMPERIALLRLDTDFYASTKHEMEHLFPLLSSGGILIIDDYGCWKGSKQAVDEYFAQHDIRMFLGRVDYTCRIGVKS